MCGAPYGGAYYGQVGGGVKAAPVAYVMEESAFSKSAVDAVSLFPCGYIVHSQTLA
jgi:hypothetical protein